MDAAGLDVEGGGKTGRETPDSEGGDQGGSQVSKGSDVGQLWLRTEGHRPRVLHKFIAHISEAEVQPPGSS